ncbi:MAG TPA: hypothetical protein VFW07_08060 [Parafilimonas sp.]|nr:hypothetical protein [Parafilimonas sp.]
MNFFTYLRCFFALLLFTGSFNAKSQTINLSAVQNNVNTLADNFPQEKIYVQFDKPSYVPGETIWFKAYIMSGLEPSAISKTAYIDFVNAAGKVLKHCISPVLQSAANGSYDLPLETKEEYVYVKAYTRWMLNFDSTFLFRKTLHITQSKPVIRKQTTSASAVTGSGSGTAAVTPSKTNIQFLPEGGNMIEGLENNIAFKATYFDGKPALVKGAVFNNKNEQKADIKTIHDGMGSFKLTPQTGETYTAKWKDNSGNNYETKLPASKESGATIAITLQSKARSFLVQRSENAAANFRKLYIIATMQQHLVYAAGVDLSQTQVTGGAIPVSDLPSGILQITLFDSGWNAIAERITFINNDDYSFEPEVGFSQLGTDKRKQNILVIKTPDSLSANLSVAVTDAGIGIDSSDDIISRLLLTADIKGTVYHPHHYFTNNSDTLQQQLDLVMLTNGWRRINWDEVVHSKYPKLKYQNDAEYLSLSGKVYGPSEQDLKKGAFIFMIIDNPQDTARRTEQTIVDASGNFSSPNIILYDTSKVYYRISGTESFANSSAVNFNGSIPAAKVIAEDTAANAFFADTATENYKQRLAAEEMRLFKMQQGTTLETVTVKTRAKSPMQALDEKYASPLFGGSDAYQFDVANDPFGKSALSVLQYLQGKVPGLNITTGGGAAGAGSVTWRGGTPSFFFNEMPVDLGYLSSVNMSDVAYIKVFRPPFIGAVGGGANGAIAIYSRKGGDVQQTQGKGIPYKVVIGYTAEKEFYSPDYNSFNERNEEQDLRSTLYWAPQVLTTPGNNTVRLKFFNNDFSQSFRVIVEGISTDGRLTRVEKVIE